MEATQEDVATVAAIMQAPEKQEEQGPTAKEMAHAEEVNAARNKARIEREQQLAEAKPEGPTLIEVAAQGMDALHAAIQARSQEMPPAYVPPARTERQMAQLQEELEAGRRTQQRAEAQQLSRPVEKTDVGKEGFTTPAYRPNDMVPDPMTGKMGAITEK